MKNIYTSYYNNKHLPQTATLIPISYSITDGAHMLLAKFNNVDFYFPRIARPDFKSIVGPYKNGEISQDEYIDKYLKQLLKVDFVGLINYFNNIQTEDIILLCYETPKEFCHRHILADILKLYDIDITEYDHTTTTNKIWDEF